MAITAPVREERPTRTRRALIDCDFHNELDSIKDLYPYLSQRWRDHLDAYGARGPAGAYYPRFMDPAKALPDPYNLASPPLIPLTPAGRQQNADLDAALATAVNDWQIAEWLDVEPRLRASMVIPFEDPPAAVGEIKGGGSDRGFG